MSNQQIESLSRALGVSRYTVKRALDHCPGVSSEMREQILAAAPESDPQGAYDAYLILPEIPAYFWGTLFEALLRNFRARGIRAKYNVYSKLSDTAVAEQYLNEAQKTDARCIIVAAMGERISTLLTELAPERCVFSLCNEIAAPNVFFFGSDEREDGRLLGARCASLPFAVSTCLFVGENTARRAGILEILSPEHILDLPCSYEDTAADLARQLDPILKSRQIDVVIGLDGISAKIAMALKKCHAAIPLFGFERQNIEERYGKPTALVCQDLEGIAAALADATVEFLGRRTYPPRKNNFIPSHII